MDIPTNAGVTPLMMAVESGKIQLVAECLNNNLNPFLRDALDRSPLDYSQKYTGNLGNDMRQLISVALNQWIEQTEEEDRTGAQQAYSNHFNEFKLDGQMR